jgi:hypothetical protein
MKISEIVDVLEGKYSGPMEPLSAKGTAKDGAVAALETALIRAKKNGTEMNYENIDAMMQRICRSHSITGQKLHDDFVKAHNLIPDNWIKKQKLKENFADGKVRGKSRPGRVKRAGASCKGSVTDLRRKAKNASGERKRMYQWCANMKSGHKK